MSETPTCQLCGEPMPAGEEMFKYHGYSGPCPTPPKPKPESARYKAFRAALVVLVREHMPWPYSDVSRDSSEAMDTARGIALKHAAALWADMGDEGDGGDFKR